MSARARAVMVAALRVEVRRLLTTCTEEQRAMFERAFPGGVDGLTLETGQYAISVCDRTAEKNRSAHSQQEEAR